MANIKNGGRSPPPGKTNNKIIMDNKQQKNNNQAYNFIMRGAIVGGTATAGAMAISQNAQAIDIATVNTELSSIATNADGIADTAFPIGAAIVGLGIIAMVLRRFIMV